MSFEEEIVLFIKAKSPLIYIVCAEEERVEYALRRLMTSKLKRVIYSWDFVNGFTPNVLNESYKRNPFEALSRVRNMFSQVPSLILFKDFQNFLSDLSISRELRNLLDVSFPDVIIQIDGGVDLKNAAQLIEAGADNLVAGTSVFKALHRDDTVNKFYEIANNVKNGQY